MEKIKARIKELKQEMAVAREDARYYENEAEQINYACLDDDEWDEVWSHEYYEAYNAAQYARDCAESYKDEIEELEALLGDIN